MRVLVLDIETSPNLAYVWKFWQENVSPKQVVNNTTILSFAAKWLDEEEVFYEEARTEKEEYKLLKKVVYLLDEADIVVVQNGRRFDLPKIRGRALVWGINPPSAVKIIDTYEVSKKQFGFASNSLEFLCKILDCKVKKGDHKKFPGFLLWAECLKGNEEAWAEMKEYNIPDILSLEEVYLKMRPWMTTHPNIVIDKKSETPLCTKCGSSHIQRRGWAHTNSYTYPRFQCVDCGGWLRGRKSEKRDIANMLVNEN